MLKNIIHIGVTIKDMERSIAFYRDILGLIFVGEILMEGPETDRLFNRTDTKARVCYFNCNDDLIGPSVELIQFINNDIDFDDADLFKTSISEICFKVDNIDEEYKVLKDKGVEFLSEPQYFDFTKYGFAQSKAVYFKDPDGIILELIQEL